MKIVITAFHPIEGKYQYPAEILHKEKKAGEWCYLVESASGHRAFMFLSDLEHKCVQKIPTRKIRSF